MGESSGRKRLSDAEVARVLRRAIDLDDAHHDEISGIDPDVLVAAAQQVGLSADAVRAAIAEERLDDGPRPGRLDRLVGERRPGAKRRLAAPSDQLWLRLEEWMRRAQFQPLRRDGDTAVWNRRTDMIATMQRTASSIAGGAVFAGTNEIRIQVEPIDPTTTIVSIEAERSPQRAVGAGAAAGSVFVAGGIGIGATMYAPIFVPLVVPALAVGGASGLLVRRGTVNLSKELERFLDRLAAGERPNVLARPRRLRSL